MLLNKNVFDAEKYIGPIKDMLIYAHKYDLIDVIRKFMDDGDPSKLPNIKKLVKDVVKKKFFS